MDNLQKYGYTESEHGKPPEGLAPARVTAVHKGRFELASNRGVHFGRLKAGAYYGNELAIFPTVGDFVLTTEEESGDCLIVKTLPRRSSFARLDPDPSGGREQAVAANFDYVFIMSSLNQDFNLNRIERYLILTRSSGAVPVVILTKADLAPDAEMSVQLVQAIAGDAEVIPVSSRDGTGLERLIKYTATGKTVVFLGMSGVGKSTLTNALMGADVMEVSEIREDDARGRHTTTHRQMSMLPSGAMVIDTPGMRSIGMWDADEGLSETFTDVEELMSSCRFSDCRHESEPGCAINEALEDGRLTKARFERYHALKRESDFAKKKADYMRLKQERFKSISKYHRAQNKSSGMK
ncbi:MAG: ribosome small subunit-dependent GTPase A [Oscillospiraceae bacterium]|nr:ribosome small subunit-dependent GTPase A [Oscillospiraceae bacterium]